MARAGQVRDDAGWAWGVDCRKSKKGGVRTEPVLERMSKGAQAPAEVRAREGVPFNLENFK